MAGYTPLFNSIVTSSIWNEDTDTRIVWITLLALADADGKVEGSIAGLAPVARVSIERCEKALQKLMSPDKYSRTKDNEGRRVAEIDGGWIILNHKKFREKAKSRAAYFRQWRAQRKVFPKTLSKETNTNPNSDTAHNRRTVAQLLFERFWKTYPKKVGKGVCRRWFEKNRPAAEMVDRMIIAVERAKKTDQWRKEKGQFIPNPSTWLNQERWDDEPPEKPKPERDYESEQKEKYRKQYGNWVKQAKRTELEQLRKSSQNQYLWFLIDELRPEIWQEMSRKAGLKP